MKVVTALEMQEIDRKTTDEYGISGLVLMEKAGLRVAERIKELFKPQKTIVLAGGGNNGGDGLVAARILHNSGWQGHVRVIMLQDEDKLSPDCMKQFKTARQFNVPISFRTTIDDKDLHAAIIVDAIFGTGLGREITGPVAKMIDLINESGNPVIAIDMPSGVSSDTGEIMGTALKASLTVTFGLPKRGHLLYPGMECTGRLFIEDIGFPEDLLKGEPLNCELLEKAHMASLVPERKKYSHKGDYGHILLVSGSRGKTGAALMASKACLRAGAGLVTIGVPESLMDVFQSKSLEEMTLPLPDSGRGSLSHKALDFILGFTEKHADILAIGPGIGKDEDTEWLIPELIERCSVPMVIDADGINSIGGGGKVLKEAKSPVIVTPHPGEMARLMGLPDVQSVEKDKINTALGFSKDTGAFVVLKGVPTIVASPDGAAFINPTGNPGMAKAGTGDVLTGIIAAFLGQNLSTLEASVLGVYMHGLAGDIAAEKNAVHSVMASDIIDSISGAFISLKL